MQRLQIGLTCLQLSLTCVLIQVAAAERTTAISTLVPSSFKTNGEYRPFTLQISENQVQKHGESSSSSSTEALARTGMTWVRGLDIFFHGVFHLKLNDEENWPKLELGWRTVCAAILGGLGAALSSAGGIGGGGLFVPLFNLLLLFDAKTSAALSNFMILGGSFANLCINLQECHPILPDKPLIDFDVVLLLQPNMLLGISTGVILNVVLPDWMITGLMIITLSYITNHSFQNGFKRWDKETHQNRLRQSRPKFGTYVAAPDFHNQSRSSENCSIDGGTPRATDSYTIPRKEDEESQEINSASRFPQKHTKDETKTPLLEPLLDKGGAMVPIDKLLALAFTWLAFFAIQVLRGGKGSESILGIRVCGLGYWLLTATQIPLALGVTAWTIHRFHSTHPAKGDPESIQEDGFSVTPQSCTFLAWMALLAGMLGGLLGIGGGMIINPFLLTIGMIPQVTAGTCASMVLFSSSMSVVQFWLMGRVPVEYALSAALLSSIFSAVGIRLVKRAICKYNRASIIVFSVATVMGVSAVLMAGFGGYNVWHQFESGGYMGFHKPC